VKIFPNTDTDHSEDFSEHRRQFLVLNTNNNKMSELPADEPSEDMIVRVLDAENRTEFEFVEHADTSAYGFKVCALPHKGFGVLAARAFKAGERIIAEEPLVAWSTVPDYSTGTKQSAFHELRLLVSALDSRHRGQYYSLADNYERSRGGKSIAGIWNTNSFKTEDVMGDSLAEAKDGVARTAIFAVISRFNHACVPNTFPAWSATIGRQTIHALRDIAAGEELTIAYVAGAEAGPRAHRQSLLQRKYHFMCGCATCGLQGRELAESDARQQRLAEIHRQLSDWPESESGGLLAAVDEHLRLMRDEGLPSIWGKAGMFLALVQLMQRGERGAAAECARKGAAFARLALGEDSSVYLRFAQLATGLEAG
jgi:hypothetical protein